MTIPEPLEKVFSLLKNRRCQRIFIAGGAAADFELAGDVDLWFPNINGTAANKFLDSLPYEVTKFEVPKKYDEDSSSHFQLNGEFFYPEIGKKVQVISCKHVSQVQMNFFDLSPHMIAINSDGWLRTTMLFTTQTQPITLGKIQKNTEERYRKLCARYGQAVSDYQIQFIKVELEYQEMLNQYVKSVSK